MLDVICAGQAVLDCITRGREAEPYRENVYRAETIRLHTGGDAVNESVALAGMGFRTAIVCGLGTDMAGDIIAAAVSAAGVDTGRIRRLDYDTPVANIQVAEDGSRISVSSRATRLEGYRIAPEELTGARLISLASLFRPPLDDPELLREIAGAAGSRGAIVCADTKLPLTGPVGLRDFAGVLPLIDYIFPNEKEAAYYTGESSLPAMAAAFRRAGVGTVVVKTGPEGCFVSGKGEEFALPAVPVGHVVDTTGAGDNFAAGFIAGILRGASLRECAALALRQAARAITHTGGGSGL